MSDESVWEEEGFESVLVRVRPLSMRFLITLLTVMYICAVLAVTYQSRTLIVSTLVTFADQGTSFASNMVNLASKEKRVYWRFLFSRSPEQYDWRELADILRGVQGVSKVRLGGSIDAGFGRVPELDDDVLVCFNDVTLPLGDRGTSISVVHGRTIQDHDEVVVSQYTSNRFGKRIEDRIEFFGMNLSIVGISSIDVGRGPIPYPCILIDFSHIDKVVEELVQTAEKHGIQKDRDWFGAHFEIEVFARGKKNADRVLEAMKDFEEEFPILKKK